MVRALGGPALPVLLALGILSARAHGGPMSVAESPADGIVTSSLYGNVIVRISSTSFQSPVPFGLPASVEPSGGALEGAGAGSSISAVFGTADDGVGTTNLSQSGPTADWQLAGSSVFTMGGNAIAVEYFTRADLPVHGGDDVPEAAPNPEPGSIALFCIGGVGVLAYGWRVGRQLRCA